MTPEQEVQWREFALAWNRAFAYVALAMISNWPRERLQTLGKEFRFKRLPSDVCDRLRRTVANGDVTCIVSQPEPFTWIVVKCGEEYFRTIWGVWVGRPASWRGKIDPDSLPHIGMMTTAEAEAKGIPIPTFKD